MGAAAPRDHYRHTHFLHGHPQEEGPATRRKRKMGKHSCRHDFLPGELHASIDQARLPLLCNMPGVALSVLSSVEGGLLICCFLLTPSSSANSDMPSKAQILSSFANVMPSKGRRRNFVPADSYFSLDFLRAIPE